MYPPSSTALSLPPPHGVTSIVRLAEDFFKSKLGISWQDWRCSSTIDLMKGLGEVATVTVGISIIPFLSAWHAEGKAGDRYREIVRGFLCSPIAVAYILAGLAVAAALPLLRHFNHSDGLLNYRQRRDYHGEHRSVPRIADALEG